MKNFNIILIACIAFIFLSSSGCSKEEDSPYTREQIIGKWYIQSFYIVDKYGNGKWEDEPNFGKYYNQYNADGTFYMNNTHSSANSWTLNGKNITMKVYYDNNKFYTDIFEIEELNNETLIFNTKREYPNNSKIKLINEKYMKNED
jgi:lipoprotein